MGDLSFNPGDSRNLMTSSGWFLVLAVSKAVFANADIILIARILSALFLVGSSVLLFRIFRDRMPDIAPFSPLPVFFMPSIPGLAGHETALALCMNLFLIWAFLERRPILFPLAAVAAYLARGDSAIFAMVLGFAYLCSDGATNRQVLEKAKELTTGIAVALIIFLLWHGYHYYLTGLILPDTFSAKVLQAESGRWSLFALKIGTPLGMVSGALGPWAHIFSLFGLWIVWRRIWPLAAWPLVHYLTLLGLGMPWYHWYYYPIEFASIVGFIATGGHIAFFAGKQVQAMSGTAPRVILILIVCVVAVAPVRKGIAGISVAFSNSTPWIQANDRTAHPNSRFAIYRGIVDWIAANHKKSTAPVILTHEIGIIGYYAPDALVYDVVGLASPAETAADMWNFEKYVAMYSPDYLMRAYSSDPPEELMFQPKSGQAARYVASVIKQKFPQGNHIVLYRRIALEEAAIPDG
jgi:hypothetical protein